MCMATICVERLQKPEEGVRTPGPGVIECHELPAMLKLGIKPRTSARGASALNHTPVPSASFSTQPGLTSLGMTSPRWPGDLIYP